MIMMIVGREPSRMPFPSICRLNESIEPPVDQSCCVSTKLLLQGNEEGLSEWWRLMMKTICLNSHLPCLVWFTQEGQGKEWGQVWDFGKEERMLQGSLYFPALVTVWQRLSESANSTCWQQVFALSCSCPELPQEAHAAQSLQIYASCVSRKKVVHFPKLLCS